MHLIKGTRIFIGDYDDATDKEILNDYAITHIISLYRTPLFPNDFEYFCIKIEDACTENISKYFDETNKFIDKALDEGYYILIHCAGGVSRSATILIAYLLYDAKRNNTNTTVDDIISKIKEDRKCIQPNIGFYMQLRDYNNQLKKKN